MSRGSTCGHPVRARRGEPSSRASLACHAPPVVQRADEGSVAHQQTAPDVGMSQTRNPRRTYSTSASNAGKSRSLPPSAAPGRPCSLMFDGGNIAEIARPRQRGLAPDLPGRSEVRAPIETPDPQRVRRRLMGVGGMHGRSALGAERMNAPCPAFSSLGIGLESTGKQPE